MKKNYQIILTLVLYLTSLGAFSQTPCVNGMVAGYPCENIDLWAFIPFSDMGNGNFTNDIWGWTDVASGREFALVGKNTGTAFVEITDPENPVYLGSLDTHTSNSIWRDIKVYQNFAFIVSEAGGHGMQVFDLTQLLTVNTPQDFDESAYYGGFGHSHNIAINEETGYAYSVGDNTFSGGLDIIDISDPLNPIIAGGFSDDGYTHDCQAVIYTGPDTDYQGLEVIFAANEDNFAIVNVEDKSDCQLISSTNYTAVGYTHQCWLTKDQKYLIFGDELDEMNGLTNNTRTYIYNVEDLDNPYQVVIYEGQTESIDHNLYTLGNLMFQSNYTSGLRIADLGGIENGNIIERGYFDCFPENDNTEFGGSWSNYPFFPSGNVILTNSESGFFIVRPQIFHLTADVVQVDCATGSADFELTIPTELTSTTFELAVEGLPGSPIIESNTGINVPGTTNITISNLSGLEEGMTTFQIILNGDYGQYIVPATIESITPAVPSGLSPANNDPWGGEDFVWDETPGGYYTIIISQNEDLSNPLYSGETSDASINLVNEFDYQEGNVYYWQITSTTACGSSNSEITSFSANITTSVDEINTSSLQVYPNPSQGKITIKGLQRELQIVVTDVSGKEVRSNRVTISSPTIDLSSLSPGMYFLKTKNNQIIDKVLLK